MCEKFSLIVPVYRNSEYLARCLDSILAQTYENIEVICVQAASVNKSSDILDCYRQFDCRVKIINNTTGGTASAVNTGIKAAQGKYVLFVEPDDYLSSNAIEHLYINAEKNNSEIVIFDYIWKTPKPNDYHLAFIKEFKNFYKDNTFSIDMMGSLSYKLIHGPKWTKMYDRKFLNDNNLLFDEDIIYEDIPFWAKVYVKAKRITYLPEPLYFYGISPESITEITDERVFDILKAYNLVEEILKNSGYWDKYKSSVQALMMTDFCNKFNLISPVLKEKFFNMLKNSNKEIDYKLYESDLYSPLERACAKYFKLLNTVDFAVFVNTPLEV